jgi:hypothetical protein
VGIHYGAIEVDNEYETKINEVPKFKPILGI